MNISRRRFCSALGAATLTSISCRNAAADDAAPDLRVIAYNIYAGKGWPDNRPQAREAVRQGEMPARLARELTRYRPDIVNFSESPSEKICQEIAERLQMNHVRFPSGGNWPGTLLSRFEISEAANVPLGSPRPKELFTRHWGRGTVALPGGERVVVHSAHLFPGADPEVRLKEVRAMLATMQSDLEAGHSMLLIGDLNHGPDTEEYRLWIDAGWVDTFAVAGKGDGFTIKADRPQYRIDYVLAAGPIAKRITESRPLFEGAFRLNTDESSSFALSDHLPQLAVFSGK